MTPLLVVRKFTPSEGRFQTIGVFLGYGPYNTVYHKMAARIFPVAGISPHQRVPQRTPTPRRTFATGKVRLPVEFPSVPSRNADAVKPHEGRGCRTFKAPSWWTELQ